MHPIDELKLQDESISNTEIREAVTELIKAQLYDSSSPETKIIYHSNSQVNKSGKPMREEYGMQGKDGSNGRWEEENCFALFVFVL